DDSVLCAYTFPGLTALSHDVVAFGSHVARRLFDVLDGAEPGAFRDSTPALHVRGSTGKAPVVRRGGSDWLQLQQREPLGVQCRWLDAQLCEQPAADGQPVGPP